MASISVTEDVFQDEIFPLKADALWNIDLIVVTAEVSHFDKSSGLNDEALKNMPVISVTEDVFQDEIFPLKANALSNIASIVVTAEVSQFDKSSWLNDEAP